MASGDSILKGTEQSWGQFSNTLQNAFATQYGLQSGIYNFLTSKFTDMINNPQGFSQQALAALRGSTISNIATQFNNARQGIGATQAARGDFGGDVKSGVNAQISGQLAGQQAGAVAGGLDQLEQANEEQRLTNQRIGLQGLNEVGNEENPMGFAGQANTAAEDTGKLALERFQTTSPGFGQILGDSFAGALGSGMGSLLTGGNSGAGANTGGVKGWFGV